VVTQVAGEAGRVLSIHKAMGAVLAAAVGAVLCHRARRPVRGRGSRAVVLRPTGRRRAARVRATPSCVLGAAGRPAGRWPGRRWRNPAAVRATGPDGRRALKGMWIHRWSAPGCLLVAVLLMTGCQGSVPGEECGDGAACASGFSLDGVFYGLSCTGVRPEVVDGLLRSEVAVVGGDGRHSVHRVRGAKGRELLAVGVATTGCGNAGDGASRWSASFGSGPQDQARASVLICQVAMSGPAQPAASGCPAATPSP
jgi:hypothetical protein